MKGNLKWVIKNGFGTYYFDDGTKLCGEYKDDKKIGKFELHLADGTIESTIYE